MILREIFEMILIFNNCNFFKFVSQISKNLRRFSFFFSLLDEWVRIVYLRGSSEFHELLFWFMNIMKGEKKEKERKN